MAYLVGALLGTFVISRFFWLVTRSWPDSVKKAVVLNIICAAIVIPIDALVRDDASFSILYVVCQAVVLGYDVMRMSWGSPASSWLSRPAVVPVAAVQVGAVQAST